MYIWPKPKSFRSKRWLFDDPKWKCRRANGSGTPKSKIAARGESRRTPAVTRDWPRAGHGGGGGGGAEIPPRPKYLYRPRYHAVCHIVVGSTAAAAAAAEDWVGARARNRNGRTTRRRSGLQSDRVSPTGWPAVIPRGPPAVPRARRTAQHRHECT